MAGKLRPWEEGIGADVWLGLAPDSHGGYPSPHCVTRALPGILVPPVLGSWKRAPPRSVCPRRRVPWRQAFLLLLP